MAASRALYDAWVRDPLQLESAKQCVATLAQCVREGESATPQAFDIGKNASLSVTIIVCSIDAEKQQRTAALYRRLFEGLMHEIIVIRHPRSLAEAYNGAVARSNADIIVLSHDDIDILASDFAARVFARLEDYDALGVVGSKRVDGPTVGWSGHPHLRGWITHHAPNDPTWNVDILDPSPTADKIIVLDGVLIAARREVLAAVPFDAEMFDGFHLYDTDWSYRASQAGFRLGVVGDLLLVHGSRGRYDDVWQRYADRFCLKHAIATTQPAESPFFEATLDNAEEVRSFYALLSYLQP